jgi:dihydrofolate reductase
MNQKRKVILYISMSLDGYIADIYNDLSFLSIVEKEGEDYGYPEFVNSVDTVIIGRKTYEKVLEMGYDYPHTDKKVYIITRTEKSAQGSFEYYTGELRALVVKLKSKPGKDIYCDGGAEIANLLLKEELIDDLIISVIPVLLGGGISLFNGDRPFQKLQLISSKAYEKGLVQLHYAAIK